MKKPSILACLAALFILTGCEKKYCFNCFTTTQAKQTTTVNGNTTVVETEEEVGPNQICDKTDDDADAYEAANSSGPTSSTQGSTVTETTITTRCSR